MVQIFLLDLCRSMVVTETMWYAHMGDVWVEALEGWGDSGEQS
jgi:hypothetical protein